MNDTTAIRFPLPASVAAFIGSIATAPATEEQAPSDLLCDVRALALADGYLDTPGADKAVLDAFTAAYGADPRPIDLSGFAAVVEIPDDVDVDVDSDLDAMADAWAARNGSDRTAERSIAAVEADASGDSPWQEWTTEYRPCDNARGRIDRSLRCAADAADAMGAHGVADRMRRRIGRGPASARYAARVERQVDRMVRNLSAAVLG